MRLNAALYNARVFFICLLAMATLVSCQKPESNTQPSVQPIADYCMDKPGPQTFTSSVTVSGNAKYEYRLNGNGAVQTPGNPIRHAEVRVTNSVGTIIQCTETTSAGNFTLTLPANTGNYAVQVVSRANNTNNTAYVMNNHTANAFYSVATTVASTSNTTGIALIAKATGTLEGAAFNILDQILNSQDYLRARTANCNVSASSNYYPDCDPFPNNARNPNPAGTGRAPLIYAYWTPGLNPGSYINVSSGLSFYLNGKQQLFILGGVGGDTSKTDMDHFDNSVIIHEYAHFIEDQFGNPDSPGGSHDGNSIIDPRLAWGEAWADFLQAAVQKYVNSLWEPVYRDTYGVTGCTSTTGSPCTGATFKECLDACPTNDAPYTVPYKDIPAVVGEGNFREFSIARLLYSVVKPAGTSQFAEIWNVLHGNGTTSGFKGTSNRFKAVGELHKMQQSFSTATNYQNWATLRTAEKHRGTLQDYATPLSATSAGCQSNSVSMAVTFDSSADNGSFASSDLFRNNDFYFYTHAGGPLSLQLAWSTGGGNADLDLYIYREGYTFGTGWMAASNAESRATTGSESVSGTLAAGNYIINVYANTGIYGSSQTVNTTYTLKRNTTENLYPCY